MRALSFILLFHAKFKQYYGLLLFVGVSKPCQARESSRPTTNYTWPLRGITKFYSCPEIT